MIKILDPNKNLLLLSSTYSEMKLESELDNGDKTLSFLIPLKSKEALSLREEGYIITKNDEFVIKEINKNYNTFSVVAKLNVEELEDKYNKTFEVLTTNIKGALELAVAGTGWTVVSPTISKKRTVRKESIYTWDLIQEIKRIFNCDLTFNSLEKTITVHEHLGSYKGEYIRENINLINITAQSDSYNFYTRIVAEGKEGLTFANINNGNDYIDNNAYSNKRRTFYWKDERYTNAESLLEDSRIKLAAMSYPSKSYAVDMVNLLKDNKSNNFLLGDTIELVSKKVNVKELQRIVKLIEFPHDPSKNYVELSNSLVNIEDINNKFEQASSLLDDVTNSDGTLNGDKLGDIPANKIVGLEAEVGKLVADKVSTDELQAVTAEIGELMATKAEITDLVAINANIDNLEANKASIGQLEAISANVGVLEADTATIKEVLAGNITSDNIQSGSITGESLNMETIYVNDANIIEIKAGKITGGEINTSKVAIVSDDGAIKLVGSTQQFLDSEGNVRIQLGKDQQGNFDFFILSDNGDILFNTRGITGNAIESGLIKEDMLGNGAVGGTKINWDSFSSEFNKDTNTAKIKATKVLLDSEKQTLDVAFTRLSSSVDENREITESNTTSIGMQQGKIETLIKDTTIESSDGTIKLKDAYSKLEQTVGGLNSTVTNQESTISTIESDLSNVSGKVLAVETAQSEFNQELNKITQKVSNVEQSTSQIEINLGEVAGLAEGALEEIGITQFDLNNTNKKVSEITTDLTGITQKVQQVENTTVEINGKIVNHETRLSEAEQKITTDAIVNTVKNHKTDGKGTFAQTSTLEQTADKIEAKFSTVGGMNLLKNGCFLNEKTMWSNWGTPVSTIVENSTSGYKKSIKIVTNGNNQGLSQTISGLGIGSKYIFSAYVYSDVGLGMIQIYDGVNYKNKPCTKSKAWEWLEIPFTANAEIITVQIGKSAGGTVGTYWFTAIQVQEGNTRSAWSGHSSEIYEGSTVIDSTGVTVKNGALKVKNKRDEIVLQGDANGDLEVSGKFTASSKVGGEGARIEITAGEIDFYTYGDTNPLEKVANIYPSRFSIDKNQNGLTIKTTELGDYLSIGHHDRTSMYFVTKDYPLSGLPYNNKGIHVTDDLFFSKAGFSIKTNDKWHQFYEASGKLVIAGDNGVHLCIREGSSNVSLMRLVEHSGHRFKGEIEVYTDIKGNVNNGIYNFNNVKTIANLTTRSYTETYSIDGEYNQTRIIFSDVQISNGKAYINIPNKYINMYESYSVSSIVKKGKGDIWVEEEKIDRILFSSDAEIKFNVEIVLEMKPREGAKELEIVEENNEY